MNRIKAQKARIQGIIGYYLFTNMLVSSSDGLGTRNNLGFQFWKCGGEMGFTAFMAFLHFFAKFLAYIL